MTNDDSRLILGLMVGLPGDPPPLSKEEFLQTFRGGVREEGLVSELLSEAVCSKDPDLVEYALIVGFTFGFQEEHLNQLLKLLSRDDHVSHENLVSAIGDLRPREAVSALYQMTQEIPEYLKFDDARALATKAIWALGDIAGSEAEEALKDLSESDEDILRKTAIKQIDRRKRSNSSFV